MHHYSLGIRSKKWLTPQLADRFGKWVISAPRAKPWQLLLLLSSFAIIGCLGKFPLKMSPEKKRHHCNVTSICLPFENEQNHFRTNQPTVQIITQRGNSNHPKFWIIRPRSHLKSLHKVIINHPANHTVPNSFSEARLIESVRLCLEGTKMRRTSSFYYVYPRREEMRVEHLKRIGLPTVLPTI